jgi:hypothetical protein
MNNVEPAKYNRFEVYQDAKPKKRVVGSAYHREGEGLITLRLWTFVQEKFYVIISKADPTKYLVMTREENHNPRNTNKYFWHIVGSGVVDSKNGVVKLHFDLFDTPIFMSLHPDRKPALTLANSKEAS